MDKIKAAIKIQTTFKKWKELRNKNLIFKLKNSNLIKTNFYKEIHGFHLISNNPIKESIWESINCNIVKNTCKISDTANGDHKSGIDNKFDNHGISNKTTLIDKKGNINISSYRLTTVCSNKNPGDKQTIIDEINKRDNSFSYYSILLRKETKDIITYYWALIPKEFNIFNLDINKMKPKIGKIGINKGNLVGWEFPNAKIEFNMSSQLWFSFSLNDINEYIICSTSIKKSTHILSYSDIYNIININRG